jgi:hypothetical protein
LSSTPGPQSVDHQRQNRHQHDGDQDHLDMTADECGTPTPQAMPPMTL